MSINIDCAYVLIGYHSLSSERNSFHVITGGAGSRATNDGMRILSGFLAFNFFLLWLHFQTELFSMVAILTWPGPYWFLLTEQPYWNKMNIPFQKSSCRCLILHLTDKCGSYVCPRTDRSPQQSRWLCSGAAGKVWSEDEFYSKEIQAFFFHKKVMDADDIKQTNKNQITPHMFTIAYVFASLIFWLALLINENVCIYTNISEFHNFCSNCGAVENKVDVNLQILIKRVLRNTPLWGKVQHAFIL